jgi:Bifunctional DNA primase/polymerase, N-terminal/AAA domain/Primase C terminal 1 (PriCT-1)
LNIIEHALRYASRGWSVFPVSAQKLPTPPTIDGMAGTGGHLRASTREDEVRALFTNYPGVGIGYAMPPGRFALDVDPRHDGDKTLAKLVEENGPLPETSRVFSGREDGGHHLYFDYPAETEITTGSAVIGGGVDVKGAGKGYVVLPPTPHPATGRPYRWDENLAEITQAPAWLLAKLKKSSVATTPPKEGEEAYIRGGRNAALTKYAGKLRAAGVDEAEVIDLLQKKNARVCRPPLGEAEVHKIGHSIGSRPTVQLLDPLTKNNREKDRGGPDGPVIVNMEDVSPEAVDWLWPGRIPLGKITILEGDAGLGKSTVVLDLIARLSKGAPFPQEDEGREPCCSLILSAEDGLEDTIRPRLDAAGADCSMVKVLQAIREKGSERTLSLVDDVKHLEDSIRETRARFVFIDPLTAYLGMKVDSHKDQDVRVVMAPLAAMAQRYKLAILALRHLNKTAGGRAQYRGGGSVAIGASSRSELLIAPSPDEPGKTILVPVKANLSRMAPALAYRLVQAAGKIDVARVEWSDTAAITADALMAHADRKGPTKTEKAIAWLRETLAFGPMDSKELQALAAEEGYSKDTLKRIREKAGAEAKKEGFEGGWTWRLKAAS